MHRIIAIMFICASCLPSWCYAAQDVSQIHLRPGDGVWSLGLGLRSANSPYVGEDVERYYFPLITYSGEKFFIDGTRTGLHLLNNDEWLVSTYLAYRFGGFNQDNSSALDGIKREDGVDGRISITRRTGLGRFTLDLGRDMGSSSRGWDVQARWG